jgi:hypothetical protein
MSALPPDIAASIDQYAAGPNVLRQALADFPADKLATPLPPGEWSALQVVGHLCDFELVYADRIQAIVAEDGPQIPGRDETRFTARLHYEDRDLDDELALIAAVRRHIARLLRKLSPADFQRVGIHSVAGPLTLVEVLQRAAGHLPHHAEFIEKKRVTSRAAAP